MLMCPLSRGCPCFSPFKGPPGRADYRSSRWACGFSDQRERARMTSKRNDSEVWPTERYEGQSLWEPRRPKVLCSQGWLSQWIPAWTDDSQRPDSNPQPPDPISCHLEHSPEIRTNSGKVGRKSPIQPNLTEINFSCIGRMRAQNRIQVIKR